MVTTVLHVPTQTYTCIHAGQPVAWCVTDYETTEVLEMFLEKVNERNPGSKVSVLMSDDGKGMHLNRSDSTY